MHGNDLCIATLIFLGSVTDDLNASSIGFWTVLFDAGVNHKCLLAVIYCLLDQSKMVHVH